MKSLIDWTVKLGFILQDIWRGWLKMNTVKDLEDIIMNITTLGEYGELDIAKVSTEQMIGGINDFINNFSNTAAAAKIKSQLDSADTSNPDTLRKIYDQIIDLY